ncbi:hypothetical protein [Metabacillus idriensis]|uniref:hypothetical protein n=1 Tax=Metabacillus idriensis TaxID=324768 RepID=UPI001CD4F082|nr:hypothetical protein [Metabacillus idriensis]
MVELEDGFTYTMVVTTPQNYYSLMKRENLSYLPPGAPMLVVSSLTEENICKVAEKFAEDNAYWLKAYYLAGDFELAELDKRIDRYKKQIIEIEEMK